jgi:hypothetical protein
MTNEKREKMIAYHEAGHAVIARVFGLDVRHVMLFPTTPLVHRQNAAWLARDADTATMLVALERDAKVTLAGPIAQQKHRYRKDADKTFPLYHRS